MGGYYGYQLVCTLSTAIVPVVMTLYIGVGRKFEVERPCCAARSAAKKMKNDFRRAMRGGEIFHSVHLQTTK